MRKGIDAFKLTDSHFIADIMFFLGNTISFSILLNHHPSGKNTLLIDLVYECVGGVSWQSWVNLVFSSSSGYSWRHSKNSITTRRFEMSSTTNPSSPSTRCTSSTTTTTTTPSSNYGLYSTATTAATTWLWSTSSTPPSWRNSCTSSTFPWGPWTTFVTSCPKTTLWPTTQKDL